MNSSPDALQSAISRVIVLGKYYPWRGGSGTPDEYSRRIVRFKAGNQAEREYFAGRVARAVISESQLNKPTVVLVPVPSSRKHDPAHPHRGELLCQVVAATPGVRLNYGNYVVRATAITPSHGRSVATRPSVEEHLATLEVRIPHPSGRYVTRLGTEQRKSLSALLFDDVKYFGATSEACAKALLRAGFAHVYAIFLGQNQQ